MKYDKDTDEFNSVVDTVTSKCKSFFQNNDRFLFRVESNIHELYDVRITNKDRKPIDSSMLHHSLTDDFFHEKFGLRFRSAAVFASDSASVAAPYLDYDYMRGSGKIYLMVPVGEYELCYSHMVDDLYSWTDSQTSIAMGVCANTDLVEVVDFIISHKHLLTHIITDTSPISQTISLKALLELEDLQPSDIQSKKQSLNIPMHLAIVMNVIYELAKDRNEQCLKMYGEYYRMLLTSMSFQVSKKIPSSAIEVMISCESYLLIDSSAFDIQQLEAVIKERI